MADPIQHVILLMLENRSFDNVLGVLMDEIRGLDGVTSELARGRKNQDSDGNILIPRPDANATMDPGPKHEHDNVVRQLKAGNAGFAADYAFAYPTTTVDERQQVMSYFARDALPATHALARNFLVCNRWFSSVPGPTWTNRLLALSGTSQGRVHMPSGIKDINRLHAYDQETIFDRLDAKGVSRRMYVGDFPLALLFAHERRRATGAHYTDHKQLFQDLAGPADEFPAFAFIEPHYLGKKGDDDHPPHNVMAGQRLIGNVYNALRGNASLWNQTLLVVTYDEHGGFYDHVVPPAAIPPDGAKTEYTFDQYGLRVPTILVSPFVSKGVSDVTFDHTSLLRYLCDRFGMPALGARAAVANSIAPLIAPSARTDTPQTVQTPLALAAEGNEALEDEPMTDSEAAMLTVSDLLEKETDDKPEEKVRRSEALLEGPRRQRQVTIERAQRFLRRPLMR